ncbi:hypothetical protein DFH94DRAFT_399244 [Russula ochroleuca]|uniref:Uncharacterized protein n=1 Tax=Russula ochroleuca TaxID=152965 RepID=A0A9P5MXT8_9AGAM|nr:hypothetical protein DFH94DRAFT_399244 [Russula ochroleuca]
MAPSPQKASWRRVDANLSPSDVGGVSSVSGQQSSPLAGQGVSSSLDDFPLPSTTFQAISSPSIAISPSSSVTATTSPAAISTPPLSHADIEMSSQPLSDALSPTNTQSIFSSFRISTFTVPTSGPSFVVSSPLTSSGSPYISAFSEPTFTLDPSLFITSGSRSLPAATTEFFAATGALDVIAPLPLDVQSKPQTPAPTDNIPSSSLFGASVVADTTSPLQLTNVLADEPLEPALTSLSSNSVPSSSSRPSVSLGGDVPVTTRAEFTDVPSPAISTPTERQPQTITAASIGGPVDTSIPNGENPAVASPFIAGTKIPSSAVGTALTVPATDAPLGYGGVPTVSAPLTSALPSLGETGTTTITGPTTTIIATTGITSVPSSVISGCVEPFLYLSTNLTTVCSASAKSTSSNLITRFSTIKIMTINSKHRRSRLPLRLFFSLAQ